MTEQIREKITSILTSTAEDYRARRMVEGFEVFKLHDIHAFYRLRPRSDQMLHVQAYPSMSNDLRLSIMARLMDYRRAMEIRAMGRSSISPGNEHDAVIRRLKNFPQIQKIPYHVRILQTALGEDIPELRLWLD